MPRILRKLAEAALWAFSALCCLYLALSGWGQPVLAGLATVPVTTSIDDPYAKVLVSTGVFVGMVWLSMNAIEIAVLLSVVQVRSALYRWWQFVRMAEWERQNQISYERVPGTA